MNRKIVYLLVAAVTIFILAIQASAYSFDPFCPTPVISQAPCPFEGSGGTAAIDPFEPFDPSASQVPCPFGDGDGAGAVDPFEPFDPSASQAPCPFGDGDGAGAVDPFEPFDPSASQVPCPFGDGDGAGAVDPSILVVPCPFPRVDAASADVATASGDCVGGYPTPTDPDEDGTYEDLNGNGRIDFADVVLFFKNMNWIRENQPAGCFDYNGNGNIDFADLILLFQEV
jgi:hypothetical protein